MKKPAEIRRSVLRAIVERDGLAVAAKRFGKPDSQINDMLAERKSFGEKVARDMERAYDSSRPPGWLDIEESQLPVYVPPAIESSSSVEDRMRSLAAGIVEVLKGAGLVGDELGSAQEIAARLIDHSEQPPAQSDEIHYGAEEHGIRPGVDLTQNDDQPQSAGRKTKIFGPSFSRKKKSPKHGEGDG